MKSLRSHPTAMTLVALAIAAGTVIAIAAGYGFGAFANAWQHVHFAWLAVAIATAALAIAAYVVAYKRVAEFELGPRLPLPLVVRIVVAGFGPFAPAGGFALDKRALHAVHDDERAATIKVLGLGALEWALLAPAAWISAVVLLVNGDRRPMPSLLWPWAIAVPIGFALGLWLARPEGRARIARGGGRVRNAIEHALHGVAILRSLAAGALECRAAWIGMALYWAFEIAAFYGAVRFIGLRMNLAGLILAYATGYALTRRSLPLGGAGVTEALMTFSLHWVGQPVAPALAVVVVYRVFNFVLPAVPALLVRPHVKPLLDAVDGRGPPAPVGQLSAGAGVVQARR